MKESRKFCSERMMLEFMGGDLNEDDGLKWALVVDQSGDLAGGREDA